MLLKSAAIFQYSKQVVSSEIWAQVEKKDMEESNTLFRDEKATLERPKQELASKIEGMKKQVMAKDQQLEVLNGQLTKFKADSAQEISDLKVKIKHMEQQWEKSLVQAKAICPKANFSEVGLDKHVIDGHIEVIPDDEDEENGDQESSRPSTRLTLDAFFIF